MQLLAFSPVGISVAVWNKRLNTVRHIIMNRITLGRLRRSQHKWVIWYASSNAENVRVNLKRKDFIPKEESSRNNQNKYWYPKFKDEPDKYLKNPDEKTFLSNLFFHALDYIRC